MQAGLASRKMTFRDIFVAMVGRARFVLVRSTRGAYHRRGEITKLAA
jgi:hypothetical protein